jgi:hypothetical protein
MFYLFAISAIVGPIGAWLAYRRWAVGRRDALADARIKAIADAVKRSQTGTDA